MGLIDLIEEGQVTNILGMKDNNVKGLEDNSVRGMGLVEKLTN